MAEKITPTVLIDGKTYPFEGWMLVLSWALAGIPWALKDTRDPAFNLRGKIDDYNRRKKRHFLMTEASILERRLAVIAEELGKC